MTPMSEQQPMEMYMLNLVIVIKGELELKASQTMISCHPEYIVSPCEPSYHYHIRLEYSLINPPPRFSEKEIFSRS